MKNGCLSPSFHPFFITRLDPYPPKNPECCQLIGNAAGEQRNDTGLLWVQVFHNGYDGNDVSYRHGIIMKRGKDMSGNGKYDLKCNGCGTRVDGFASWFASKQKCPDCGINQADVIYAESSYKKILGELKTFPEVVESQWIYFDILPLIDRNNIISFGEGTIPIERWTFLETLARDGYGIDCRIYAHRNDLNRGTGTFKDLAGTVVASVLKENDEKNYVAASTGNTAVSYSKYLAAASIDMYGFIPLLSSTMQLASVGGYGQKVFQVKGDYARAKEAAHQFSDEKDYLLAAGNFDPMRIEAKKTMVYEWLRLLDDFPTVYIQALSGGTGPLAIEKAFRELEPFNVVDELPRQIMVQPSRCAPMAHAWDKAKAANFPEGWEKEYPIYQNPETAIATLSTGNPKTYPVISQFVKKTNGEIVAFDEDLLVDVARFIAMEAQVFIGPAAVVPAGGLIQSMAQGLVRNGDIILLNVGEGAGRAPDLVEKLVHETQSIDDPKECTLYDRNAARNAMWKRIADAFPKTS